MRFIKKLIFVFLIFLFWINPVHAQDIKVTFNGENLQLDVSPIIENGRVLIPVRQLSEIAGAKVDFLQDKQEVIINKDKIRITLRLDNKTALVNEREVFLSVAPKIVNGRTLVPLRFISEYLGFNVSWSQAESKVSIEKKGLTEQILWDAYLNRYHAPFSKNTQYAPSFVSPFSFSSTIDLNLQQEQQTYKLNVSRNGRFNNNKFTFSTNGSMQNESNQTINDEFYEDFTKRKAYRNQGNGWSRFRTLGYMELDEKSGYQHQILSFLLLNNKNVELNTIENNGRKQYQLTSNLTTDKVQQMSPLVDVLESNFLGIFEDYGDRKLQSNVTITMDAESLLMISSKINFTYTSESKNASYAAAWNYRYDDIPIINDIVVQNTGLETVNDVLENERFRSFGVVGEFDGYQVKGSVLKDGQRYIKVFSGDKLYREFYENRSMQTLMYRGIRDPEWTSWTGTDPFPFLLGNKNRIIYILNSYMAVPMVEIVTEGGRQKKIFTFAVSADHWEDADQLIQIVDENGISGHSFDVKAEAKFVFVIDTETEFIDSLITEVTVTDRNEKKTTSQKFSYSLNQVETMPIIQTIDK